ncbi:hypothetical protein FGE12_07595 [Aggregicoccus sp. 17bor-14]|uniref:hypothetical protein n=1 Tax=Myxococcaceae TaxID=31 RepID=UPI00129CC335|nr:MULTISPECIES: hypothetical protein [Myxococcaceae]MBF5042257.1 hypothetical protein [Simulacricoccus sp. 17bor-14]MRI88032.1 hypothetical protein [Aggregicoccus sp. 17bor-14]
MRTAAGVAFLLLQLVWMLVEQRGPTRYFCWAPNDYMTRYHLEVRVAGRALSPAEIQQRYHLPAEDLSENVPQHLIDILEQRERTSGRGEEAAVALRYRVNGREERTWSRP